MQVVLTWRRLNKNCPGRSELWNSFGKIQHPNAPWSFSCCIEIEPAPRHAQSLTKLVAEVTAVAPEIALAASRDSIAKYFPWKNCRCWQLCNTPTLVSKLSIPFVTSLICILATLCRSAALNVQTTSWTTFQLCELSPTQEIQPQDVISATGPGWNGRSVGYHDSLKRYGSNTTQGRRPLTLHLL